MLKLLYKPFWMLIESELSLSVMSICGFLEQTYCLCLADSSILCDAMDIAHQAVCL